MPNPDGVISIIDNVRSACCNGLRSLGCASGIVALQEWQRSRIARPGVRKIGTFMPAPAYLRWDRSLGPGKRRVGYVLQSMRSARWQSALLPELWRTYRGRRGDPAGRARSGTAWLPTHGAAGGFSCCAALAYDGHSVDGFCRLLRTPLAARTAHSSCRFRGRTAVDDWARHMGICPLPSRRMAPPPDHRRRIRAGHPVAGCGYGLADAPALGPLFAIVVAVLTLIKPFFGTILAIYTLWVMLETSADQNYAQLSAGRYSFPPAASGPPM